MIIQIALQASDMKLFKGEKRLQITEQVRADTVAGPWSIPFRTEYGGTYSKTREPPSFLSMGSSSMVVNWCRQSLTEIRVGDWLTLINGHGRKYHDSGVMG